MLPTWVKTLHKIGVCCLCCRCHRGQLGFCALKIGNFRELKIAKCKHHLLQVLSRVDLARLLRRAYSRPFWITFFEFVKVCGIRFSIWECFIGFYICRYPITTILTCLFFVGARISWKYIVGHLFQNYDTIYVRFFPTYTCNHSCYTIYVRFSATYTYVLSSSVGFFFPSIGGFHAISGDTNNNGEMNKCWWTNKAS